MFMIISTLLFFCILTLKCVYLWNTGIPKHKYEYLELNAFCGEWYFPLGIPIPRILSPLFAIFEGKFAGFNL